MRLLLDTHALLWALEGNTKLSTAAARAIGDPANVILVSMVSPMEIALKHKLGKLPEAARHVADWSATFAQLAAIPLSATVEHGALAGSLDLSHRDPFDRLLIAQALVERVPLVSNEMVFDAFGVERIW